MNKESIKEQFSPDMENLLLILTEMQNQNPEQYISRDDMIWIADYLNTTLSSVYGVVNYYSMFSIKPRGRYILRVCRSPVCAMMEGKSVVKDLEKILSITNGEVTSDGMFSIETVECLGHCEKAPAMMVNEDVYGYLTTERLQEILSRLQKTTKV